MSANKVGPHAKEQLTRLAGVWRQGEHLLISGATNSGKTALARHIDQIRVDAGGHVVVFVCKLRADETITEDYKGWTRWKKWKKNPAPHENRILLWADTDKLSGYQAVKLQREVFGEAIEAISKAGRWTVHFDEGLYMCDPRFMNMERDLAMMHYMGRASKITCITLTQRPAHIPLVIYSSASHAMIGRAKEASDVKRLSELGGKESGKAYAAMIEGQGRHDFLWLPVAPDWDAEPINLRQ